MIKLLKEGRYRLIETKEQTKILLLDGKKTFAWINAEGIGEILVTSHKTHQADCILALGRYRLYTVQQEPRLIDTQHLELCVGSGEWQGYLLPTGLPNGEKTRNRIIPTRETITKSSRMFTPTDSGYLT